MEERERKGFECKDCGYIAKLKHDLDVHMRKHTGERPYSCIVCGKSFTSPGNRNRHQLTHTGEKPFQCDLCLVKFTEKGSLTKHQRIHTGENLFECEYCGRKFTQSGHLRAHIQVHTGVKLFKCTKCDKSFTQKAYLDEHFFVHEKTEFPCSKCDIVLKNLSAFKRHRRKHDTNKKKISCTPCGKEFLEHYYYKRHVRVIHLGEKPFACTVCSKNFRSNYLLKRHTLVHTVEKPFHCSQCEKQFVNKASFRHHMQQYKGEFYYCPHCNIGFVSQSDLDEHWTIHPDEPIVCLECKEVFSTTSALKLHKHNHIYEKNLNCPFCARFFIWKRSLKKHIRRKHAYMEEKSQASGSGLEKPFQCTICDEQFSSKNAHIWHEVCVHGSVKILDPFEVNKANAGDACKDENGASERTEELTRHHDKVDESGCSDVETSDAAPDNVIYIKEELIEEEDDVSDPLCASERPEESELFIKDVYSLVAKEDVDTSIKMEYSKEIKKEFDVEYF